MRYQCYNCDASGASGKPDHQSPPSYNCVQCGTRDAMWPEYQVLLYKSLQNQLKSASETLSRIAKWEDEFPETGRFWDDKKTRPMSYAAAYGSNGERDFMRELAWNEVRLITESKTNSDLNNAERIVNGFTFTSIADRESQKFEQTTPAESGTNMLEGWNLVHKTEDTMMFSKSSKVEQVSGSDEPVDEFCERLFHHIKHGDEAHQKWLHEEIRKFYGDSKELTNAKIHGCAFKGWQCFHCGEIHTTVGGARDHFGADPTKEPGCLIKVKFGDERGLEMELRNVEADRDRLQYQMQNESTEADLYVQKIQGEHSIALRREEEKGYARGLDDGRKLQPSPNKADVPEGYIPIKSNDVRWLLGEFGEFSSHEHKNAWRMRIKGALLEPLPPLKDE